MTEASRKLIAQLSALRFEYAPRGETLAQRTGAQGIVNLFALASHMLTALTGTLAIVSIGRLGVDDEGGCPAFRYQVQKLTELAVETSAAVERLIGMALVDLQSIQITSQYVAESASLQEVIATGHMYAGSLSSVSMEVTNMARRQGLWGGGRQALAPRLPARKADPALDQARESVQALIAQIIELELGVEQFGGRWTMA